MRTTTPNSNSISMKPQNIIVADELPTYTH